MHDVEGRTEGDPFLGLFFCFFFVKAPRQRQGAEKEEEEEEKSSFFRLLSVLPSFCLALFARRAKQKTTNRSAFRPQNLRSFRLTSPVGSERFLVPSACVLSSLFLPRLFLLRRRLLEKEEDTWPERERERETFGISSSLSGGGFVVLRSPS